MRSTRMRVTPMGATRVWATRWLTAAIAHRRTCHRPLRCEATSSAHAHLVVRLRRRTTGLLTQEVVEPNTPIAAARDRLCLRWLRQQDPGDDQRGRHRHPHEHTRTYDTDGEFALTSNANASEPRPRVGSMIRGSENRSSHTGPNGLTTTVAATTAYGRKVMKCGPTTAQTRMGLYLFCSGVQRQHS